MSGIATRSTDLSAVAEDEDEVITAVKEEIRTVFEEHPFFTEYINLDMIDVFVAEWKSRRGYCRSNMTTDHKIFGERLSASKFSYKENHYCIGVARRIYEDDHGWEKTTRHELVHAFLHAKHGKTQGHNDKFQKLNNLVGGSSGMRRKRKDFKYALACPNGCFTSGYYRRVGKVQRPWTRVCNTCSSMCVSHDYDGPRPDNPGTCGVSSIEWGNVSEYNTHPTKKP